MRLPILSSNIVQNIGAIPSQLAEDFSRSISASDCITDCVKQHHCLPNDFQCWINCSNQCYDVPTCGPCNIPIVQYYQQCQWGGQTYIRRCDPT